MIRDVLELCVENTDKITEGELFVVLKWKEYKICRTEETGVCSSEKKTQRILYSVRHKSRKEIPATYRTLPQLKTKDPLFYAIKGYDNLSRCIDMFPRYRFEVVGHTVRHSPIVRITHFDNRVAVKTLKSIYLMTQGYDPFDTEYSRLLTLAKAKANFPNYNIEVIGDLGSIKKIQYKIEDDKGLFDPVYVNGLGNMSCGKDPFLKKYLVYKTMDDITKRYLNHSIQLLPKKRGESLKCRITELSTGVTVIRSLNTLSATTHLSPMGDLNGGYSVEKVGFLYVNKYTSKSGSLGIIFGISGVPKRRLLSHMSKAEDLQGKLEQWHLFSNNNGEVARDVEKYIKSNFTTKFFKKGESPTYTETLDIHDYIKLMDYLKSTELEEVGLLSVSEADVRGHKYRIANYKNSLRCVGGDL